MSLRCGFVTAGPPRSRHGMAGAGGLVESKSGYVINEFKAHSEMVRRIRHLIVSIG
jgi:hypothetical protein